MTDREPTQEQIKEFWEWCGFTYFQTASGWVWVYPDGETQNTKLPPVDLSNLFKYAVPKLWLSMGRSVIGFWTFRVRLYPDIGVDYKQGYSDGYDPALALFRAIWEVIKE